MQLIKICYFIKYFINYIISLFVFLLTMLMYTKKLCMIGERYWRNQYQVTADRFCVIDQSKKLHVSWSCFDDPKYLVFRRKIQFHSQSFIEMLFCFHVYLIRKDCI